MCGYIGLVYLKNFCDWGILDNDKNDGLMRNLE